jgi:hypothetical protein
MFDDIVKALEEVAQRSVENDRSVLELVKVVINRLLELEDKIERVEAEMKRWEEAFRGGSDPIH